jgi:hypothetical protein
MKYTAYFLNFLLLFGLTAQSVHAQATAILPIGKGVILATKHIPVNYLQVSKIDELAKIA